MPVIPLEDIRYGAKSSEGASAALRAATFVPGLGAALLAVAVQVQVTLPIGEAGLRVNAADPLAVGLAALFLAALLRKSGDRVRWLVPAIPACVGLLTAVLLLSLVVGRHYLGEWNSWAVFNRFVGWHMLLAYGLAGAWITARLGGAGQRLFLQAMLGAAMVILISDGFPDLVAAFGIPIPKRLQDWELVGAMVNSNALAFFILMALAAFLPLQVCDRPLVGRRVATVVLFVLLLSLWYTASRGAWLAGAVLIAAAACFRLLPWRSFAVACTAAAFAALGPLLLEYFFQSLFGSDLFTITQNASSGHSIGDLSGLLSAGAADDTANIERFMLAREALAMWQEHKIFGAGLGAFLANDVGLHKQSMIIHNTGLWILTEMGLVGAVAFIAVFGLLIRALWPHRPPDRRPTAAMQSAAFLALIGFAAMSLTHEVMYQRTLWLLLGMALALPPRELDSAAPAKTRRVADAELPNVPRRTAE